MYQRIRRAIVAGAIITAGLVAVTGYLQTGHALGMDRGEIDMRPCAAGSITRPC